jgi:hypothetical protein
MRFAIPVAFALIITTSPALAEGANLYEVWAHQAAYETSATQAKPRRVRAPIPPVRPHDLPAYVRGRLTCAINVNRLLAMKGVEGTKTALALDFLSWGRPTAPQPGAVQIERRGRNAGHVRVVSHHDGIGWKCLNPSARHQNWTLTPCEEGRVIAWRAAT